MIEWILAFSVRALVRAAVHDRNGMPQAVGRRRWCSKAIVWQLGRRGKFVDRLFGGSQICFWCKRGRLIFRPTVVSPRSSPLQQKPADGG